MKHYKIVSIVFASLSLFACAKESPVDNTQTPDADDRVFQNLREDVILRLNHPDGIYAKGDIVRLWADVKALPDCEVTFKVMKNCSWTPFSSTVVNLTNGENLLLEETFNESAQYVCELTDGKDQKNVGKTGVNNVFAGFVVDTAGLEVGFEAPDDLWDYWSEEIAEMRKDEIKPVVTNSKVTSGYRTYHVQVNCVGPKDVQAYVAHPENAENGTLPIIVSFHAASSIVTPSKASTARNYAKYVEGGALAMDMNTHGILDDQQDSYYKEISEGELNGYAKSEPNKEDYCFKWMILRALRAIDYLTENPLWDGRNIIVTGTSQGGYQSAAVAGLDERVTAAILTVPAGIDQGGSLKGRTCSWPNSMSKFKESSIAYSPYFDGALLLRHTKADIWCLIGLYDYTCPAANLLASFKELKTDMKIITLQRSHNFYPGDQSKIDDIRKQAFEDAVNK